MKQPPSVFESDTSFRSTPLGMGFLILAFLASAAAATFVVCALTL